MENGLSNWKNEKAQAACAQSRSATGVDRARGLMQYSFFQGDGLKKGKQQLDVCFVSHTADMGGAERSMVDLLGCLVKDDISCHVLLPRSGGDIETNLKGLSVPYSVIPFRWWTLGMGEDRRKAAEEIVRQSILTTHDIAKLNPRIIYTNTSVINIGAIAAKELGIAHLWHVREYGEQDHALSFILEEKERFEYIGRNSNCIIFNSYAVRDYFSLYCDCKRSNVIYNDVLVCNDVDMHSLFINSDSFHVLIVGTIQRGKGQKDAIIAINELKKEGYDVELAIVGSGDQSYLDECKRLIDKEFLHDRVHFTGYLDNAFPVIKQCDALLICSKCEAFGRVTIEGMLAGKPVIATNSGGTVELITDGVSGLLYEPGDYKQLKEKIKLLINNSEIGLTMGAEAYKWATDHFHDQRNSRRIENIINTFRSVGVHKEDLFARAKVDVINAIFAHCGEQAAVLGIHRDVHKKVCFQLKMCRLEIERINKKWCRKIAAGSANIKSVVNDFCEIIYWLCASKLHEKIEEKRLIKLIEQSNLFDNSYYLECNPDVARAGINPVTHYLIYGGVRGPRPQSILRQFLLS